MLSCCAATLKLAGLTFRAAKSRSIVLIKGRPMDTTPFSILSPRKPSDFTFSIPFINSRQIKFLGKIIDGSIFVRKPLNNLEKKTFGWSKHH